MVNIWGNDKPKLLAVLIRLLSILENPNWNDLTMRGNDTIAEANEPAIQVNTNLLPVTEYINDPKKYLGLNNINNIYPIITGGTPSGRIEIISNKGFHQNLLNSRAYATGKANKEAISVATKAPRIENNINSRSLKIIIHHFKPKFIK